MPKPLTWSFVLTAVKKLSNSLFLPENSNEFFNNTLFASIGIISKSSIALKSIFKSYSSPCCDIRKIFIFDEDVAS